MFSTFVIKILIIAVTKEFLEILLKSLKLLQFIKEKSARKKITTGQIQKQPSRGVLRKRCSGNMQQIYRRTLMPKSYISQVNKVAFANSILFNISKKLYGIYARTYEPFFETLLSKLSVALEKALQHCLLQIMGNL